MFKEHTTEEIVEMINNSDMISETKQTVDEITITLKKEEHSLDELKQKLINDFYQKPTNYCYNEEEVEILRILFENEKD